MQYFDLDYSRESEYKILFDKIIQKNIWKENVIYYDEIIIEKKNYLQVKKSYLHKTIYTYKHYKFGKRKG